MLDVLIIGGGPAGLSAALVLGRARRRVVVVDSGRYRNAASGEMHGFLTRDGVQPREFLGVGRAEVERYGVEIRRAEAVDAWVDVNGRFRVKLDSGEELTSRRMLLATGVRDVLPRVEGIEGLYGTSVHHCPYCDGWEHRDERLVAYGKGKAAVGLALSLRTWSERVTACTNEALDEEQRGRAARNGIEVREEMVVGLEGEDGKLRRVVFESGPALECDAMFFNTDQFQRSDLARRLGCEFDENGGVKTEAHQRTCVPGLLLAGDAEKDVQFVIVAAAQGATAAVVINRELQDEDRGEAREE